MRTSERTLLRIYLRNTDKSGLATTAEAVVRAARDKGLAGGTVLRGILGLDVAGSILKTSRWALVEHVPVVVELIDTRPAIDAFLASLAPLVGEGLATLERTSVRISPGDGGGAPLSSDPREGRSEMKPTAGKLARIFIDERDQSHGTPLYQAIVDKAKELGLAGAAVFRASMGFGTHRRVHAEKLVETSSDLPLVVELVDSAESIDGILPFLDEHVAEGLVTLEEVELVRFSKQAE